MRTMKFLLLFVLIVGISADASAGYDESKVQGFSSIGGTISDIISKIIKTLVDKIKSAIPDPISVPKLNITLQQENLANGSFVLSDLVEIGVKNFNTSTVSVDLGKSSLNVVVDIPSVNINTNYFSDLLLGEILPMYGEGPANIRLKNLRFNLTSKYSLSIIPVKMQIKNTTLLITLGDAVFDIHGMINNEAFSILCSQILDDTVDVFINKHNVLISKLLSPVIESVLNKILANKNTAKAYSNNVPVEMEETEVMELRNLFISEIMKQPLVSKYVSF